MVALFVAVLVAVPGIGVLPLLGLGFAGGLAVASVAPLWGRTLGRTPLFTWGMVIAHLGIAVSLAGMASDAAFTKEPLVAARVGEPPRVGARQSVVEGKSVSVRVARGGRTIITKQNNIQQTQ